jgi:hypothetical protein
MTRFKQRTKRSSSSTSSTKNIIALIAGAGAAYFVVAIFLLASRLGEVVEEHQQHRNSNEDRQSAHNVRKRGRGGRGGVGVLDKIIPPMTAIPNESEENNNHRIIDNRLSFPPLPAQLMAEELYGSNIIINLLEHNEPTIAGIIALLQRFLSQFHTLLLKNRNELKPEVVIQEYIDLVDTILGPFEVAYRGRPIFPIRDDGSIFISLAAYRDHLLGETLRQAFNTAAYPDKLYIGAVVQNCFGLGNVTCKTGVQVTGTNPSNGQPITAISDKAPDVNGIEEFCTDPSYIQYCNSGQIRVLYVNETESNGPCQARYLASKLWGGEMYYMQSDAHLRFVPEWDRLYIEEIMATQSYPKAILSSYPPGFNINDPLPIVNHETRGSRLCTCEFTNAPHTKHGIIRINSGHDCRKKGVLDKPYQTAYIAAGFFFTRSEFLVDVPFDPYLPWIFMGEEIALSLRAYTHGWDIYAPRLDYIVHQYRPGSMGLPKFWENTMRVFGGRQAFDDKLSHVIIDRIKYMVGYVGSDKLSIAKQEKSFILTNFEHYGPGHVRSVQEFLDHTGIDMLNESCNYIEWCNECDLP